MSFACLAGPQVNSVIDRFAGADEVTLVVGAGASMEADLPSWSALIAALLRRVASSEPSLRSVALREEWIRSTIERDGLLGAGAIVEVSSGQDLHTILPEELYGSGGAAAYEPGPIALQVARLREVFGEQLSILTTNYDDLLERAFLAEGAPKRRIRAYVRRRRTLPAGTIPITHLHGYAGRDRSPSQLILTEAQYHRMQRGTSWQEQLVTERLRESVCLFVGTSLTDPNLIRYLYGYEPSPARPHAAIFVRQGEMDGLSSEVRAAREAAVGRRWARCGVEAVFVDHFADAAQLLYEIGHRRQLGSGYVPLATRAREWVSRAERLALCVDDADAFARRQLVLSGWLRRGLHSFLRAALAGSAVPGDEQLGVALWLVSRDGTEVTGWAHSDRAHQEPGTMTAVPIREASDWVAVRTICQGVRVERDRDTYASRWRFVRGLPLVTEKPTRLPVGCVTISSTKRGSASVLRRLPAASAAELHRALVASAMEVLTGLAELAETERA